MFPLIAFIADFFGSGLMQAGFLIQKLGHRRAERLENE
jgi:hypothetical protein